MTERIGLSEGEEKYDNDVGEDGHMMVICEEEEEKQTNHSSSSSSSRSNNNSGEKRDGLYNSKKPFWWKRAAGRRGSKAQRAAIQRLGPKYIIQSSSELCNNNNNIFSGDRNVCLEIGCGQGHVLLHNAKTFPNTFFIGAEIHKPALGAILLRIEKEQQQQPPPNDDSPRKDDSRSDVVVNDFGLYKNVMLYGGDGMQWLRQKVPSKSLSNIYITFPDPFPNRAEYRIIQKQTLEWMSRVLKINGCVYIATDDDTFHHWSLQVFSNNSAQQPWHHVEPYPSRSTWLPIVSRYEQKGLDEGRSTHIQCWKWQGTTNDDNLL